MHLRFRSDYGYGWRTSDGQLLETPAPFSLEAEIERPERLEGKTIELTHLLAGKWVEVTLRTDEPSPTYNVRAFASRADTEPLITGFASLP